MEKDTVLIIGSGATRGSGVKRDGECLPTDAEFFQSKIVGKLLGEKEYPLLTLLRKTLPATNHCSLSKTWNAFFTLRGLVGAGVIRLEQGIVDAFHSLGNHVWLDRYSFQGGHYAIPHTHHDYYIVECAIWALRTLVHDVYDPAELDASKNSYQQFWEGVGAHFSAVVNMNFDTTFDDFIGKEKLYYPGDGGPANDALEIIRPHGSLGWTSENKSSHYGRWDQPDWFNRYDATKLEETGFHRIGETNQFEFKQAMIVPQPVAKEEVIGNSTVPGLGNQVLREQWIAFERALREAKRWVFVGFSMASGDDYLELLFRHCASKEKQISCSAFKGDTTMAERMVTIVGDRVGGVNWFRMDDELRMTALRS